MALAADGAGGRSDSELSGGGGELAAVLGPDGISGSSKLVGVPG